MKVHAVLVLFCDSQDRDSTVFGADLISAMEQAKFEAANVAVTSVSKKEHLEAIQKAITDGSWLDDTLASSRLWRMDTIDRHRKGNK